MASTVSPTRSPDAEPNAAGTRPDTPAARMTARSADASWPTMLAVAVRPLLKITLMVPAPPAAASMTWLLVRMVPSEPVMTPEPSPS